MVAVKNRITSVIKTPKTCWNDQVYCPILRLLMIINKIISSEINFDKYRYLLSINFNLPHSFSDTIVLS